MPEPQFSIRAVLRAMALFCVVWLSCFAGMLPMSGQTRANWNGGNGNWSTASDWSTGVVPNGNVNVFIDNNNSASSTVTLNMNASVNNLTIDSDDALAMNNGQTLTVLGTTISNAGNININGTGSLTTLDIGAPSVTLTGGGTVTMTINGASQITGVAPGNVLVNQETIQGAGQIGGLVLNNQGTINANSGSFFITTSSGFTNTGIAEASNGFILTRQASPTTARFRRPAAARSSAVREQSTTPVASFRR